VASLLVTAWSLWRVGVLMGVMGHGPTWAYPVGVLAVLMAHEAGHAVMGWHFRLRLSWPVFFPWPLPVAAWLGWTWLPAFGTLGAFLSLPGRDRLSGWAQWWVAMMGPLWGFTVAVSLLVLGIWHAVPSAGSGVHSWARLPVPLLVAWLVPPGLIWHPFIMVGWLGILITGLNLLPIPGLDGWTLWSRWAFLTHWQRAGTVLSGGMVCACLPWF